MNPRYFYKLAAGVNLLAPAGKGILSWLGGNAGADAARKFTTGVMGQVSPKQLAGQAATSLLDVPGVPVTSFLKAVKPLQERAAFNELAAARKINPIFAPPSYTATVAKHVVAPTVGAVAADSGLSLLQRLRRK